MSRDPLRAQAESRPEAPAVDVGGVTWTFAEADEGADRVARHLAGAGMGPGRTVAALVPNGPKLPWVLHGVPRAGATLAPLNTRWTDRELVEHLQLVDPAVVLCTQETEARAARVTQGTNLVSLDASQGTRALHLDALPAEGGELPGPAAADPHTVMPTSGTSGRPKAAAFQVDAHLAHARAASKRLSLSPDDRWLATLAPAHIGGFALWFRAAVVGSCVVPAPGFEADHVARLADEGQVTHASLVPAMLHALLEAMEGDAPDAFELALVGGAACPSPLLERALDAGWPVALTYGCTEAASQVATAPPEIVQAKPGTVGEPLDGVEVRTGDGDDEVLVRGPTLAEGYLGEDELAVDPDGWLSTGDAGRLDDEGHLWITGRLSERIVSGGLTVDPVEVEDVIREHPGVAEACVVGVPDERWGEAVTAAVVTADEGVVDAETLADFVRDKLASGKRPRGWAFVDELPRNANGKVDRDAVRVLVGD